MYLCDGFCCCNLLATDLSVILGFKCGWCVFHHEINTTAIIYFLHTMLLILLFFLQCKLNKNYPQSSFFGFLNMSFYERRAVGYGFPGQTTCRMRILFSLTLFSYKCLSKGGEGWKIYLFLIIYLSFSVEDKVSWYKCCHIKLC